MKKKLRLALLGLAIGLLLAASWEPLADKYLELCDEWNPEPINYSKAFLAPLEKAKAQHRQRLESLTNSEQLLVVDKKSHRVVVTNVVAVGQPVWKETLHRSGER